MVQLEGLMKLLKVSQKRRTSSSSPLRNSRSLLRDASLLSYPYKYPVRNRGNLQRVISCWLCVSVQVVSGFLGSCAAALVKIARTRQVWRALQDLVLSAWCSGAGSVPPALPGTCAGALVAMVPQCCGAGLTGDTAVARVCFRTRRVWA